MGLAPLARRGQVATVAAAALPFGGLTTQKVIAIDVSVLSVAVCFAVARTPPPPVRTYNLNVRPPHMRFRPVIYDGREV